MDAKKQQALGRFKYNTKKFYLLFSEVNNFNYNN